MVGSIGECLIADAFDLALMPASNEGFDATDSDGRRVEIKATQSTKVAFRRCPDFTIVIGIHTDGTFMTYYNGPGSPIWDQFVGKTRPSNGQYSITINRLRQLNDRVDDEDRIAPASSS